MVKVMPLLKRKPGLSNEEFNRRWLEEHTKISSKLPWLWKYIINMALKRQPEGDLVDGEPIYDGTAELYWDSVESMENSLASQIGKKAGADADSFASIRVHIYTEEHIVV